MHKILSKINYNGTKYKNLEYLIQNINLNQLYNFHSKYITKFIL
jgi:hypothetical protein